ncbi:MAG: class I SAM-dependent methyltransferase [Halobacteriota archaeon]
MVEYDPEQYWSKVGQEIQKRDQCDVAGYDDPVSRYRRDKFLQTFLDTIDFRDARVLEVGCGPGGNLKHIAERRAPQALIGVDISQTMINIAAQNVAAYKGVELYRINGKKLPFEDQSIDISFTVTVLQHVTDEEMLTALVQEICRVTKTQIVLMEEIGTTKELSAEGSFTTRQVDAYKSLCEENGFKFADVSFLNTKISRLWLLSVMYTHKRFVNARRQEGEPISRALRLVIEWPMFITCYFDRVFKEKRDLAKMTLDRA